MYARYNIDNAYIDNPRRGFRQDQVSPDSDLNSSGYEHIRYSTTDRPAVVDTSCGGCSQRYALQPEELGPRVGAVACSPRLLADARSGFGIYSAPTKTTIWGPLDGELPSLPTSTLTPAECVPGSEESVILLSAIDWSPKDLQRTASTPQLKSS